MAKILMELIGMLLSAAVAWQMLYFAFQTKHNELGWRAFFYVMAFVNAVSFVHFYNQ